MAVESPGDGKLIFVGEKGTWGARNLFFYCACVCIDDDDDDDCNSLLKKYMCMSFLLRTLQMVYRKLVPEEEITR